MCEGALLVVDAAAYFFSRLWCCAEWHLAERMRKPIHIYAAGALLFYTQYYAVYYAVLHSVRQAHNYYILSIPCCLQVYLS